MDRPKTWNEEEDAYWRENYRDRSYASEGSTYDYYQPGYRYGYEAATRYPNRSWDEVEADLSRDWNAYEHRGDSTWEQMKDAIRDAWDRITGTRTVSTR